MRLQNSECDKLRCGRTTEGVWASLADQCAHELHHLGLAEQCRYRDRVFEILRIRQVRKELVAALTTTRCGKRERATRSSADGARKRQRERLDPVVLCQHCLQVGDELVLASCVHGRSNRRWRRRIPSRSALFGLGSRARAARTRPRQPDATGVFVEDFGERSHHAKTIELPRGSAFANDANRVPLNVAPARYTMPSMRRAAFVGVIAALGCNSSQPPSTPAEAPKPSSASSPAPPPPDAAPHPSKALHDKLALNGPDAPAAVDPNETVRLVAHTLEDLRVYRIAGGTLTLEATLPTQDDWVPGSAVWRDANELVLVRINKNDPSQPAFIVFRDGAFKRLDAPPAKLFARTPPSRTQRDNHLTATANGEVWFHHCRRHQERDPHDCLDHASVRVLPAATAATRPPPERPPLAMLQPPTDTCPSVGLKGAQWLSLKPSLALVGEDDDKNFIVGCKPVDAFATHVERGPRGFWALFDLESPVMGPSRRVITIVWQTRVVGVLPEKYIDSLMFSP